MTWIDVLTLIGSIGLFLYGLRLMSEGLQKAAGDSLRKALSAMHSNRFAAMLMGVLITALIQSSTATTVILVSFVNSGLVTLAQSMAVIMGANVGTTLTTWIIALFGFKFNIAFLVFPLIALSLPFFNSNSSRKNAWGEFLIGFALLFLGLEELKHLIPIVEQYPSVLATLRDSSSMGYGSILIFVLAGMLLTILVQATSATFAIALLMCVNGWITFEMGCALVLGSNIGTCLTPLLASLSANTMAKRAALGHLLFNVLGMVWALAIFYYFCDLISYLCSHIGLGNPHEPENVALGLAMFHTVFNFISLCLMLPLTHPFASLLTRLIPEREDHDEDFKLQYINGGFMTASSEMALVQVQKEALRYGEEVYKMYKMVQAMLDEQMGSERQLELNQRIRRMEEDSDRAELEIAQFLNSVSPKTLSDSGEQLSRNIYKEVDAMESIADALCHISMVLYQKYEQRVRFTAEMNANLSRMMSLIDITLSHALKVLGMEQVPQSALNKAYNHEDEINNLRNQLRNEMFDSLDRKKIDYYQNSYFMHIINECEKIGDYAINVVSAASE